MESLFLLIPVSLLLLALTCWVLFRALRDGQFDDLERPGWQVLFDDRPPRPVSPRNPPNPPEDDHP